MTFRRLQLGEGWKQCWRGQKGPEPITKLLITIPAKRALTNYSLQSWVSPRYSSAYAGKARKGWLLQVQGRRFGVGAKTNSSLLICLLLERTNREVNEGRQNAAGRQGLQKLAAVHEHQESKSGLPGVKAEHSDRVGCWPVCECWANSKKTSKVLVLWEYTKQQREGAGAVMKSFEVMRTVYG